MEENELMPVSKDLGLVTAYGYAKEGGFEGTEEEFDYAMAMIPEAFRRLGEPDFSTTLNSVKLKIGEVGPNQTLSFDFVNHSDRQSNSNNFVLIFGSNQYFRPDNYSWGSLTVSDSGNNWNMDRFRRDIDGARVHAEVENHEGIVKIRFDVVTKEGSYRYQWYELAQTINEVKSVVLTVDHSYADVFTDLIRLYDNSKSGGNSNTTVIGKKDFSTELQQPPTVHSTPIPVPYGWLVTMQFINHSDKQENWHNAIIVLDWPDAFMKAYLRLDNFTWGDVSDTPSKRENNWNWSTFRNDVDGAFVQVRVFNIEEAYQIEINVLPKSGVKTYRQFYQIGYVGNAGTPEVYLTVDHSYIEINENTIEKKIASPMYGGFYVRDPIWAGSDPYILNASSNPFLVVDVPITKRSKIDLQPDDATIKKWIADGVQAIYAENANGSMRIHAIGGKPSGDFGCDITVTEVEGWYPQ